MTDKHKKNGADADNILDQFSDPDREITKEVWLHSKKAHPQGVSISEEEIEDALQNVHHRIHQLEDTNKDRTNIAGSVLKITRYIAAAVALIVFGIGILLVPKTMTVPNAETAVIDLPDGSSVEINSGTTIRYNRLFSFTNRTITLNGEAYFSVEPGDDPFLVEANGSATEVTGTEFNVRSWHSDPASETTVTVTEGTVRFYPEDDKSNTVSLSAGQTSRWNRNLVKPGKLETESTDALLAWRDERIVFHETPFIVILNDLERSFDVDIELDVDGTEMEPLTAYYNRPANIESILEDLCTVKGLRFTKTANGYRIFK